MEHYDVVIAGAGPAGGQCARELAAAGKKVLLLEKAKHFGINNYSSGGAYLQLLDDFQLPKNTVAAYWDKLAIHTCHDKEIWTSNKPLGVVFDFMKLRAFLAQEAQNHGAHVRLGVSYHHHEDVYGRSIVYLKNHITRSTEYCTADVIVDATGSERKVLANHSYDKSKAMPATGIEFLIEAHPDDYARYSSTLSSFLGPRWMPQGYGWIFPMDKNQLKIGVIRYYNHDQFVPHEQSYLHYLEQLIGHHLNHPYEVLDKHGKTIYYSLGRKDRFYLGNVIAIGDAVSMLNPMAAEGIRHGLHSGRFAAQAVQKYLAGNPRAFNRYVRDVNRYCRVKWNLSELVMRMVYREGRPERFTSILKTFRSFQFKELMELLFYYRPLKFMKFFFIYVWNCWRSR